MKTDFAGVQAPGATRQSSQLSCARCGAEIASTADAAWVAGNHEHTHMNPAGSVFHIACFSRAENTYDVTEPTFEATWFPGYAWRITLCVQCHTHLGWHFAGSTGGEFWAFIQDRLIAKT